MLDVSLRQYILEKCLDVIFDRVSENFSDRHVDVVICNAGVFWKVFYGNLIFHDFDDCVCLQSGYRMLIINGTFFDAVRVTGIMENPVVWTNDEFKLSCHRVTCSISEIESVCVNIIRGSSAVPFFESFEDESEWNAFQYEESFDMKDDA